MNIRLINSKDEFEALEPVWNDLLFRSESNHINLTFEWMKTWFDIYGSNKILFILIAEDDEGIVGIFPLMIQNIVSPFSRLLNVKRLTFMAAGISDNLDFIIVRKNELVIYEFFNFIFDKKALWDELVLCDIDSNSSNQNFIKKFKPPHSFTKSVQQPYSGYFAQISGNFHEYYSSLSKEQRRAIKKRSMRLGNNFTIKNIASQDVSDDLINEIQNFEKKRKRYKISRGSDQLFNNEFVKFITTLSDNIKHHKWIKIFKLIVNEKLAAYVITFDYNQRIFAWLTSYNLDFFKYSVGLLIHKNAIEFAFNNNYKYFDFMRGDEPYKKFFCNERYLYYRFSFTKNNAKMTINRAIKLTRKVGGKLLKLLKK